MRLFLTIAAVACTSWLGACDNAADQKRKADEAQIEADKKIAEANSEANEKAAKAQAEADRKTAEAQANFLKMREDYRHDITTKLVSLDRKIADLQAKSLTATGKSKTELDARLSEIRAEREAFTNEYKTVEQASASTWDATKARLDKAWERLSNLVDRA